MTETNHGHAKVEQIKRWSPVWIVPIVTLLIGGWILFYHFSHQGPEVTLITENAEGIVAGKTKCVKDPFSAPNHTEASHDAG